MRQAGYLAAAAIYGIDHHWHRMQQDHDKAKSLGEVLSKVPGVRYLAPLTPILLFLNWIGGAKINSCSICKK